MKFKVFFKEVLNRIVSFLIIIANRFKKLGKKERFYVLAILGIVLILLWAFITAAVVTCNFNREQMRNNGDKQKVDAVGIIITETKSGTKYFEIYGENGNYSNDNNIATLNHVVGNFYKDGAVSMSFQSSKGSYNEKEGVITLYDNTFIVLKDGTSLEADKLIWSGSDKDTIAEGNVKIKKENDLYSVAEKCIIGAGYDKFKIVGNTTTKIYNSKEKQ